MTRDRLIDHAIVYVERAMLMLNEAGEINWEQALADVLAEMRAERRARCTSTRACRSG